MSWMMFFSRFPPGKGGGPRQRLPTFYRMEAREGPHQLRLLPPPWNSRQDRPVRCRSVELLRRLCRLPSPGREASAEPLVQLAVISGSVSVGGHKGMLTCAVSGLFEETPGSGSTW